MHHEKEDLVKSAQGSFAIASTAQKDRGIGAVISSAKPTDFMQSRIPCPQNGVTYIEYVFPL